MECGPLNAIATPNCIIGSKQSQLSFVHGPFRRWQMGTNQGLEELCCWEACLGPQETQMSWLNLLAMNSSLSVLQGRPCPEKYPETAPAVF